VISVMHFFEGRVRKDGGTRIALYRDDGAMPGESKVDGSSSAPLLAGCFSLFLLAVPGCYLPLVPVKKRGFLRPEAGILAVFLRDLQRYQRRPRAAAPVTSSASESLFERGPNEALCVHRIIDRRHHAKKGVDHTGKLLVLDRHAGALQRLGI
jgi:hypothetical protein